jgi:hypothetical protein
MSMTSNLLCFKIKISLLINFVVGCHLKDIQIVILFNPLINNTCLKFNQKMQMIIMMLKKHRKQRFYVTFFNNGLTLLATNKWKHKTKGLQLKVQLFKIYIIRLFFSDFFKKEKKESKTRYKFYATTCSILQYIYIYIYKSKPVFVTNSHSCESLRLVLTPVFTCKGSVVIMQIKSKTNWAFKNCYQHWSGWSCKRCPAFVWVAGRMP